MINNWFNLKILFVVYSICFANQVEANSFATGVIVSKKHYPAYVEQTFTHVMTGTGAIILIPVYYDVPAKYVICIKTNSKNQCFYVDSALYKKISNGDRVIVKEYWKHGLFTRTKKYNLIVEKGNKRK